MAESQMLLHARLASCRFGNKGRTAEMFETPDFPRPHPERRRMRKFGQFIVPVDDRDEMRQY